MNILGILRIGYYITAAVALCLVITTIMKYRRNASDYEKEIEHLNEQIKSLMLTKAANEELISRSIIDDKIHRIQQEYPEYGIIGKKTFPTQVIIVPELPNPKAEKILPYIQNMTAFLLDAEYYAYLVGNNVQNCRMFGYTYGINPDTGRPDWFRWALSYSGKGESYPITEVWSNEYFRYMNGPQESPDGKINYSTIPFERYIIPMEKMRALALELNSVHLYSAISCRFVDITTDDIPSKEEAYGNTNEEGSVEHHQP